MYRTDFILQHPLFQFVCLVTFVIRQLLFTSVILNSIDIRFSTPLEDVSIEKWLTTNTPKIGKIYRWWVSGGSRL